MEHDGTINGAALELSVADVEAIENGEVLAADKAAFSVLEDDEEKTVSIANESGTVTIPAYQVPWLIVALTRPPQNE